MNQRNVIVIPATKSGQPDTKRKPGKIYVAGYARVIKGTGAGVQIRKNIRNIIADRSEWEFTSVTTDYNKPRIRFSHTVGILAYASG